MSGPVPKPKDARRRRNTEGGEVEEGMSTLEEGESLEWPEPSPHWSATAKRIYASMQTSGQAAYYEPVDVAMAVLFCDVLSLPLSGEMLAQALHLASNLLLTVGDRRRLRLELKRKPKQQESASVRQLHAYREQAK